jgi:hypothetical protein
MADLRSRLERIGERVRIAPDAFERLERARRRHERNRRIAAGVVALLVAIAGSLVAFSAFRAGSGVQPGGGGRSEGFFALWPEQTADGLAAAQEAVDQGDPDLAWRADPRQIAERFALEKLRWPAVTVTQTAETNLEIGKRIEFDISVPAGSSCEQIVVDATCPTTTVILTLAKLGRPDGLWSVVQVSSDDLALPLAPGQEVASGTTIDLPTTLPAGESVSMGVSFFTTCDGAVEETVAVSGGTLEFVVPHVPAGCVGYVYAITPKTGARAFPVGSFLLADGPGYGSIEYLLDEVSAVPVLFKGDAPGDSSNVAEFACDETGTIAPSTLAVDAQSNGVHIAVTDTGGEPVSFTVASLVLPSHVVGGDGVKPGERKETVWQLPPGDASVSCSPKSAGGTDSVPIADLQVSDSSGLYVPIAMSCPTSGQIPEFVEGAVGIQGDPVKISQKHLSGLEFDDTVERAGYPNSEEPVVRVVRRGDIVALVTFRSDGQGGWLNDQLNVCTNLQIGWSVEPTGVSGPMPQPMNAWDALCAPARAGGGNNVHNGADLHVEGRDFHFDTRCLIAPAGRPVTILFTNLDGGIPRNISIYPLTPYLRECIVTGTSPGAPDALGRALFSGKLITGTDEIVYELGRFEPGEYYFQDDVHPEANGVLVVE